VAITLRHGLARPRMTRSATPSYLIRETQDTRMSGKSESTSKTVDALMRLQLPSGVDIEIKL